MSLQSAIRPHNQSVVGHYINGRLIDGAGRTLPVTNPATGKVIRQV